MSDSETEIKMSSKPESKSQTEPVQKRLCSNLFLSIKVFVLCHSLLQLAQLMISGYLKSSISTIEKRFGLSSQTSGLLAAFNEVGNTTLIVFVSYFGSRVHRPRLIGLGAVLVALAGLLMSLPHFIAEPYRFDHVDLDLPQDSASSLCVLPTPPPALPTPPPALPTSPPALPTSPPALPTPPPVLTKPPSAVVVVSVGLKNRSNSSCALYSEARQVAVVGIMFLAQTLLGIGAVPIQPFGISYIDDFAHPSNSPLYLGILFAVTLIGPGLAYGLGSLMLRFYVDIDRMPEGGTSLTPKDPRWVGAWWLGFLVSAGAVTLTALPYFFFPREMPKEKQELSFRKHISPSLDDNGESSLNKQGTRNSPEKEKDGEAQIAPDLTVIQFIKIFPQVLLRNLRHPIFLLVVLAQVNMSSMVAGMATFLPKFLERQFSVTASFANLLIGSISIPAAIVGIMTGGILVHRLHLGPTRCAAVGITGGLICVVFGLPLFFMGCPTHPIANVYGPSSLLEKEDFLNCTQKCSCSKSDFNPVCDTWNRTEYLTPCQAGCTGMKGDPGAGQVSITYTNCRCLISGVKDSSVTSGSCESSCSHLLLPFILFISLGGAMGSITHTPSFMLILRGVKNEDKSLAVGMQFMLQRVLAWMPSPVIHGIAIDTACVFWADTCGTRSVCRYYDHTRLRHRFIGLQFFYKLGTLVCFTLVFIILRQQEKEAARSRSQHGSVSQEEKLILSSEKRSGESIV
ncbi:solute carrier organic anion transporter family member 2B1 isoform X1 [Phascolarctos cinereus]|nr:solute carrier organic anion transporter family member 2B1 isoform X2 [Phascolarctos cinereus]XP_020845212.1 solute carrier organic anion transporter family member 2B1 isoform X2 [Phascolarctos cinereus]XP_020845213.1 solute carrier organic anion transporter family member 2B1 isoform X2 [Phascolarctos cinereus]XP_020845214.1 solute carrier organic anion transporter family member 2B1 isoform X2 [Phascolarctos cinereus]